MTEIHAISGPELLESSGADPAVKPRRFARQAMATLFEIVCVHEDLRYAEQAAGAAFDLIERLETELTCHRSSSDVSRINHLNAGEAASVSPWTMECLLIARHFYAETGGAFDVSLGTGLASLELLSESSVVRAHADGVRLNLGGIGKGFALDRAGELLEEWEIRRALLHGGFSSVLVLDPPPDREGWPLTLSFPGSGPAARILVRVRARNEAWSASGIRKQDHIVDPRTGIPVRDRPAVWVSGQVHALAAAYPPPGGGEGTTPSLGPAQQGPSPSAIAEALSTACMILSLEEIAACCRKNPGVEVRLLSGNPSDAAAAPVQIHFSR